VIEESFGGVLAYQCFSMACSLRDQVLLELASEIL
jgi:hypothetical protein